MLIAVVFCSDARWKQVDQEVSYTNLVPFLQKFVNTAVVYYTCSASSWFLIGFVDL